MAAVWGRAGCGASDARRRVRRRKRKRPAKGRAIPFDDGGTRASPTACARGSRVAGACCPSSVSDPASRRGPPRALHFTRRTRALAAPGGAGSRAGLRSRQAASTVPRSAPPSRLTQLIVGPGPTPDKELFSPAPAVTACHDTWRFATPPVRNEPVDPPACDFRHERGRVRSRECGRDRAGRGAAGQAACAPRRWSAASAVPSNAKAASATNASCEAATKAARSTGVRPPSSTRPAWAR